MIAILITVILGIPLGNAFSVSQPYIVVGNQGQASLYCAYNIRTHPKEIQLSLYKGMYGEEMICTARVNLSDPYIVTDGRVHCRGNVSKGRVDLTIFGLKGEDTDLYRCKVEIIFPPPYLIKYGNGTLVHIPENPECPREHTQAIVGDSPDITKDIQRTSLPLILICAVLITTTFILILQVMNMILTRPKSIHVPQKSDYKNFW